MAGVVILGLTGEDGLWVVDLEAGAVLPLDIVPVGDMATAASYRSVGASFIKGVNFAVHVTSAAQAAEGLHEIAQGLHEVASGLHENG
ncbi:hypothetical protein [Rhizobium sp. WL3]|uniref:hypothetical protein n=1 Tax=Rhizobium sp. WL3 TaxID=2603277 RepID=UPI001FEF7F4C|nr:hypothetical protein [Rhizobium sp. WL3]